MQELLFVCSVVIGMGLLSYGAVVLAIKTNQFDNTGEAEQIKDMLDIIQGADPGTKVIVMFMLGGTLLMQLTVKLIDLPFDLFNALFTKKSA